MSTESDRAAARRIQREAQDRARLAAAARTAEANTCTCGTTATSSDGRHYPAPCMLHPREYVGGNR